MICESIPLDQFRTQVLDAYRAARRSPRTVSKMEAVLSELARTVAPDPAESSHTHHLTTAGIGRWIERACASRASNAVIGLLGYVRAACAYAADEGMLDRMPAWRRLRPRRTRAGKPRHHSAAEVAALLDHLEARARRGWKDHRLYVLVALVAYTGLRRDEAPWLRVRDLHLGEGRPSAGHASPA